MKTTYVAIFVLFTIGFSCTTSKQFDSRAKTARETNTEFLVVANDGKIIPGTSFKEESKDKKTYILLDDQPYQYADIMAYQDKNSYSKKINGRFATRLVKGKISLYYFTVYHNNEMRESFSFEKGEGKLIGIGVGALRTAVTDNSAALKLLNKYYPKDNYLREMSIEKLVAVVEMYNK